MNPQLVRRVVIPLHKSGALAVANDVAAWEAQFRGRILEVEVYLGGTGTTSGQTTVDVKKNAVSVLGATVGIAFNAATKRSRTANLTNPYGEPSGHRFQPGDYFQADVLAIPGVASADLSVYLHVALEDV